jgi:hypothetical protein
MGESKSMRNRDRNKKIMVFMASKSMRIGYA